MNDGDWYKDQFKSLSDAQKVGNGWPYYDAEAGCWKIRTYNRKPPYQRARAKREAERVIRRSLGDDNEPLG